jgi:hypothetical protein
MCKPLTGFNHARISFGQEHRAVLYCLILLAAFSFFLFIFFEKHTVPSLKPGKYITELDSRLRVKIVRHIPRSLIRIHDVRYQFPYLLKGLLANSMDPDQTVRMHRLIWNHAGRKPIMLVLS